ncbi:MAG: AmmeMemoRadiSam system protein B [Deltaproteobacteria bacterium]|nr:AmmeMemoRadiSam system protein B [Deltaproteobacteria bacterium]
MVWIHPHTSDTALASVWDPIQKQKNLKRLVILMTNHTGQGARVSVPRDTVIPLKNGSPTIDQEGLTELMDLFPPLKKDALSFEAEDLWGVFSFWNAQLEHTPIIPILVQDISFERCVELGKALQRFHQKQPTATGFLALANLVEFVKPSQAKTMNQKLLHDFHTLPPKLFFETWKKSPYYICGLESLTSLQWVLKL